MEGAAVGYNFCCLTEKLEQQYCIILCHMPGDTQGESSSKIQQDVGNDSMSMAQTKKLYNHFYKSIVASYNCSSRRSNVMQVDFPSPVNCNVVYLISYLIVT